MNLVRKFLKRATDSEKTARKTKMIVTKAVAIERARVYRLCADAVVQFEYMRLKKSVKRKRLTH